MPVPLPLLRGTLDLLIVRALRWEPTHGTGVATWIRYVTAGLLEVDEGSLYPALRRLEARGLIESEWSRSDHNRRARIYQVTARGREWYWAEQERWQRYTETVDRVLRYGTAPGIQGR
jgi:transcriptional regulator